MSLLLLLALQADFKSRVVATIPEGTMVIDLVSTPDGKGMAYSLRVPGQKGRVVHGDWRSDEHDTAFPLALSRDGRRVHYVTSDQDGSMALWVDEKKVRSLDTRSGDTFRGLGAMSADGSVALTAVGNTREGWWGFAINGKTGVRHPSELFQGLGLSLDGKVYAGWAMTKEGFSFAIINDVAGPMYDDVIGPVVSENGVVAYVGEKEDATLLLHHEGKIRPLKGRTPRSIFISADGLSVGFVFKEGERQRAHFEDLRSPEVWRVIDVCFDAKAERIAGRSLDESRAWHVFVDGKSFEAPGILTPVWFSPDGRKIGYGAVVGREVRWVVVESPK